MLFRSGCSFWCWFVFDLFMSLSGCLGDSEKGSLERRLSELQGDAEARGAELEEVRRGNESFGEIQLR